MIYKILLLLSGFFLFGCQSDFTRTAGRIDNDMVRSLSFSFENPEIMPGDTAVLYAKFAGKEFDLNSIEWRVSWDIKTSPYGNSTAFDNSPLDIIASEVILDSTNNSSIVKISFLVPDSVVRHSSAIPKQWKNLIYDLGVSPNSLPSGSLDILDALPDDKDSMIDLIEFLIDNPSYIIGDYKDVIEPICQIFTVNFNLYADGITDYSFKKESNRVRYQRGFKDSAPVYLNNAPNFSDIFLYTYDFDILASENAPTAVPISIDTFVNEKDTIEVPFEDGKSYALVFHQNLDSTLTISEAFSGGTSSKEEFSWSEFSNGSNNDIELISYFSGSDSLKFYGLSEISTNYTSVFWIKAIDNRFGVMGWPRANSLREIIIKSSKK